MQNATVRPRSFLRRTLRILCWALVLTVSLVVARCLYAFRDRDPAAAFSLNLDDHAARAQPRPLRVGFGRVKINPDLSDPARPVWLAGFDQHRAATKIHDDLWAVACVLDDGHRRVGIVALDSIGLFHEDVMKIRRRLAPEWKIQYAVVCATHNHSTPDLMGLWGPDLLHTGVDPRYQEQVMAASVQALGAAVAALRPARVALHEIRTPPDGLVTDTRKPQVFDADIRVMHFTNPTNGATIGTIVNWGDHPETPWGRNTEITADYCGYLRDALERGVEQDGRVLEPGLGGVHLFVNGAIGGLMTTSPGVTVHDPYLNQDFKEPSHDKARALGRQLFSRIKPRLGAPDVPATDYAPIGVRARSVLFPLDNVGFLLAPVLGLMDRGHARWMKLRSEVALVTIGEAGIACVPGEIYPEIVNGGIERAPGGDFGIDPVEVPPIRAFMPGKVKFLFGLANDEVGYIIPKSEWDRKPPYLYGASHAPYGEVNSVGPDIAGVIHTTLREFSQTNLP
jgi:hypothetical protein